MKKRGFILLIAPAIGFVAPPPATPALSCRNGISLAKPSCNAREWLWRARRRRRGEQELSVATASVEVPEAPAASKLRQEVLQALSTVVDPDLGQDIVTLGFIKELRIVDDAGGAVVSFEVELTTPACPVKEQFRDQCKELVEALPGVAAADVTMTAQAPRPATEASATGMSRVSSILAVSSCKGGVGKSTTAVNLAYALHRQGARVGILDADIHGPSLPTMVRPQSSAVEFAGNQIKPLEAHGVKLMSYGYVNPGAAIMRGPMVVQLLQQFVGLTSWGELDYLVIDMPPGTGDVQLTLCQALNVTAAVVVTTPQRLSFADVVKGIDMFDAVNIPSVAVVENMAFYEPPGATAATGAAPGAAELESCVAEVLSLDDSELKSRALEAGIPLDVAGDKLRAALAARSIQSLWSAALAAAAPNSETTKHYLFGKGHAKRLANMWGIENTIQMPLAEQIARLGDSGVPLVVAEPDSAYARAYGALATSVVQEVAKLRHGGGQRPKVEFDKAAHAIVVQLPRATGAAAATAAAAAAAVTAAAAAAGAAAATGVGVAAGKERRETAVAAAAAPAGPQQQLINPAELRRKCRCAACVEELTGRPILRPEDVSESVEPLEISAVGNYAVAVAWSDGHKSLYPYAAFVEGYAARRRRLPDVAGAEEDQAAATA